MRAGDGDGRIRGVSQRRKLRAEAGAGRAVEHAERPYDCGALPFYLQSSLYRSIRRRYRRPFCELVYMPCIAVFEHVMNHEACRVTYERRRHVSP